MIRNLPSPPQTGEGLQGRIYTDAMILRRIYDQVRHDGPVAATARRIGVSKVFLGKVIKGEKPIGETIAEFFGYDRYVVYMKKPQRHTTGVSYLTPRVEPDDGREVTVNPSDTE